jgi:hypothetical protein
MKGAIFPIRMISLVALAGGLTELLDWRRAAFAAWRYLLSSSYRQQIQAGLKFERSSTLLWTSFMRWSALPLRCW